MGIGLFLQGILHTTWPLATDRLGGGRGSPTESAIGHPSFFGFGKNSPHFPIAFGLGRFYAASGVIEPQRRPVLERLTLEVSRRDVIRIYGPGLVRVVFLFSPCLSYARSSTGQVNWPLFVSLIRNLAEDCGSPDEEYVASARDVLLKLKLDDHLLKASLRAAENKFMLSPEYATPQSGSAFEIASLIFGRGQSIRHHDHPRMTAVQGCISGNLLVKNYDLFKEKVPSKSISLKQECEEILTPSHVSSLTAERGNIHFMKAEERTQIVDIFTPPYDNARAQQTHWYGIDDDPVDRGGNKYRAVLT